MDNKMYIVTQKEKIEETYNKIDINKVKYLLSLLTKSNIAYLADYEFNKGTIWEFRVKEITKVVYYFKNDTDIQTFLLIQNEESQEKNLKYLIQNMRQWLKLADYTNGIIQLKFY